MDYKDFTDRDTAYKEFIKLRKEVIESAGKGNFNETFTELCTRAMTNDCVAQDVVAYFFNKGLPDYLLPNYENYMAWQILAGANGNEFSLEKMEFFMNSALEEIVDDEEILTKAFLRKNIKKNNALKVIGNLICEGIVDELNLNPKNLIKFKQTLSTYAPEKTRVFLSAMEKCLPKVVEFLVS